MKNIMTHTKDSNNGLCRLDIAQWKLANSNINLKQISRIQAVE